MPYHNVGGKYTTGNSHLPASSASWSVTEVLHTQGMVYATVIVFKMIPYWAVKDSTWITKSDNTTLHQGSIGLFTENMTVIMTVIMNDAILDFRGKMLSERYSGLPEENDRSA